MIKNYFKTAWRSLWKNKTFSLINIVGLTVGMTCCLLMVLFIQHELNYDKFQKNGDRIVRVIMEYKFGGDEIRKGNYTSTKVFPSFKKNFPEVVDGVRMSKTKALVNYKEEVIYEKQFLFADSTFFKVFSSFPLLKGQPEQVLKNPYDVVVTESTARKYFGSVEEAVGKVLLIGSAKQNYLVKGVVGDIPSNSQIKFDFLASFSSLGPAQEETYWNANYTTYLLLRKKESIASLQAKIPPFMEKEMKARGEVAYLSYELEPYTRVHLFSPHDGFEPNSNIKYIYIISAIALLILLIGCFTYINLSTARSIERAREVGIRKVAGAVRGQVFWQFIIESLLIVSIAFVLSFVIAYLVLPWFNNLADRKLDWNQFFTAQVLSVGLLIGLVISLLAGSYPALILSNFQPIKVLKGAFKNSGSGLALRKSLIVFQFMISVFLLVSTFVIQKQMKFIQNTNLGYNREHVIVLNADQKIAEKIDVLKTELKSNSEILSVSKAYESPVHIKGGYSMFRGDQTVAQSINTNGNPIDEDYVKTTRMEILSGTDLTRQDVIDASHDENDKNYFHFIINESAAKALGWTAQTALGKTLYLGEDRRGEVKAVVRDFHFQSLHNKVSPLVMFPGGWSSTVLVKTSGQNLPATLKFIEKTWKTISPYRPFEYRFMDEDFQNLYKAEQKIAKVFSIFSGIAILLACLGLFGLSAYSAQQRIKEIGVRKVLGASVPQLILLLSGSFLRLVVIAFLIVIPIAWFSSNKWLSDFEYRTQIGPGLFIWSSLLVVAITLITVSIQSIKAAWTNPVKSLRSE